MRSITEALRKPGSLVAQGGGARTAPMLVSAPKIRIKENAFERLEAAMHAMKNYEMLNLKPSVMLLRHDHVIKNFKFEFDTIKEHKKKEVATPQIIQKLDIVRWSEAFLDFLSRIIGSRNMCLD